jgi:hypothetical protein
MSATPPTSPSSSRSFMRAVGVLFGIALTTFGFLGLAIAGFALLDPAGTQLSNDAAPFASPPAIFWTLVQLFAFVIVAALGVRLLFVQSSR